jgi:exopolysaccharide biosynthesis WecB/TagA/CpsF family protein
MPSIDPSCDTTPALVQEVVRGAEGASAPRFLGVSITEGERFPPPLLPGRCWVYVTLNAEIALDRRPGDALTRLVGSGRARVSIDGQWVLWALQRQHPERALHKRSGSDLIHVLAAHAASTGRRVLLLGSTPQANGAAVRALLRRHPGAAIAGFAPGSFEPDSAAQDAMRAATRAAIEAFAPDFVVCGLGAAKEHAWAWAERDWLDSRVAGVLCFGGAIDLAAGFVRRAPLSWQRLGLEGLYRVGQQPRRLWRLVRVMRVLPRWVLGRT